MIKIIILPKWIPEFIKKWIYKDGNDGDVCIRDKETLVLGENKKYSTCIIEKGGILDLNHYKLYVSKKLIIDGELKL